MHGILEFQTNHLVCFSFVFVPYSFFIFLLKMVYKIGFLFIFKVKLEFYFTNYNFSLLLEQFEKYKDQN
jgi:hypothetical protein